MCGEIFQRFHAVGFSRLLSLSQFSVKILVQVVYVLQNSISEFPQFRGQHSVEPVLGLLSNHAVDKLAVVHRIKES